MATMVSRICICGCKQTFEARAADVKRGWGKYFSKSCKAIHQEKRTGQHAAYKSRENTSFNPVDDIRWSDHDSNIVIDNSDTEWDDDENGFV